MTPEEDILRRREYRRRWREKNREYALSLTRAWQKKNKDRVNARCRELYAANPDLYRAKTKAKRDRNRGAFNAWSREWKRKHPEYKAKRIAYEASRRAAKAGCESESAAVNALVCSVRSKRFATCYYCSAQFRARDAHFDHIIPLSRGGPHSVGNVCVSCPSCNLKKGSKKPGEWQPEKQSVLPL